MANGMNLKLRPKPNINLTLTFFSIHKLVLLYTFFVVLCAFATAQYQIDDPCNVGDHEENQGLYEAHPSDCGKYLQCLHGRYGERPCAPGLHWNVEERACDWPLQANCEDFDIVQRDEVDGPCDVGDHKVNEGLYRPHPSDCGLFLECLHGKFAARPCPFGLHWNVENGACDWPVRAKCQQIQSVVGGYGFLQNIQNNDAVVPVPPIQKV